MNPEYWNVDYLMVNFLKSYFVNKAINLNVVQRDMVAWIDFGYAKTEECVQSDCWNYDFNPERIHLFSLKETMPYAMDIRNVIATNDVTIMGCHIVAHKKLWYTLDILSRNSLDTLLDHNLCDDDQTILLMNYLICPFLFEVHRVEPIDWFVIFRKFNNVT